MKDLIILALTGSLAASLAAADSEAISAVKAGAKKLAAAANYSWVQTTQLEGGSSNYQPGPIEGKAEKGGYTYYTGTFGDNTFAAAFKGEKSAFKAQEDWQSVEELEGDDRGAWIARRLRSFKAPAAEAEDLPSKVKSLKKNDDGAYAGELSEEGVKELLGRWGRRAVSDAKDLKGSAKFWLKAGAVSKYEYNVQGTFKRQDSDEEVKRSWTSTVEIKDVGTTKVTVPDEAKKKLS